MGKDDVRADIIRDLWETHRSLNKQIWFSHAKAAVVMTFTGTLLGALHASGLDIKTVLGSPLEGRFAIALIAYALLATGLGAAFWSMHKRRSGRPPDFVSMSGIAAFPDPRSYWQRLLQQSDNAIVESLARDVYDRAQQVNDGYRWLVVSTWIGFAGSVIAAILLATG
jgi:hypothetical protein